jgi:hypothetical protein
VTATAPRQQTHYGEHETSPHWALVLSVRVLSLRGPRVSCGTEVGDGLAETVSTRAALSGTPTLSGVTVADGGRPAVPGGPVRVESMTWTTPVLSFLALGAGPAWSSVRLWQAAIAAAAAARRRICFMRALPVRVRLPNDGPPTYENAGPGY